jgi:hypothetical protein
MLRWVGKALRTVVSSETWSTVPAKAKKTKLDVEQLARLDASHALQGRRVRDGEFSALVMHTG